MTPIDPPRPLRNVVGGERVDSLGDRADRVLNPATEEGLAEPPRGPAADVERAVGAPRRAAPAWRATTPAERAGALLRLADLLEQHAEELARLETLGVGKPLAAAAAALP